MEKDFPLQIDFTQWRLLVALLVARREYIESDDDQDSMPGETEAIADLLDQLTADTGMTNRL